MEKVKLAKEKGFLISPKLLEIPDYEFKEFLLFCEKNFRDTMILTEKHYKEFLSQKGQEEKKIEEKKEEVEKKSSTKNIKEKPSVEKIEEKIEKKEKKVKEEPEVIIEKSSKYMISKKETEFSVEILKNFENIGRKRDVNDFLMTFLDRYNKSKEILRGRINPVSIGNLSSKEGSEVETVGMISEIIRFKNAVSLTVEDPTGSIKVIITNKSPAWDISEFLIEDVVIGIKGTKKGDRIFANDIIFPDIPERPKKTVEDDVWACFIGDFHFGSKMIDGREIKLFIEFLKGKIGDEKTREIAGKIKYIIIPGDLVDGVGVYPNQKEELDITDIYLQYEEAAKYLEEIPDDKLIIIAPGNHDAVGLAEPQPPLKKDFSKAIKERLGDRVLLLSNPSYVRLHSIDGGLTTLIYHGYSFDRLIDRISVFRKEGYKNSWKVMRYMLQVRHLAPLYGSSLQIPNKKDYLFIDIIPDIFVMGHIHYLSVGEYRGTHLIVSSTWQAPTSYQIMLGHEPQPGFVPLLNLKERRVRVLNFGG